MVWYTDSFGPQLGKVELLCGFSLTIGMNGWEPGGKEWPTSLTFMQIGGSISSFMASSYFDLFIEPSKVLVLDMLLLVMLALANFCCS